MALVLSTSWNASSHRHARPLLKEIKELGFRELELSFNLTPALAKELLIESRKSGLKITSLHNYCPIPPGFSRKEALPDCFSLSSLDARERISAIKYTKKSIDFACNCGCYCLVLHCGRVEIPDRTRELINIYRSGGKFSRKFKLLKARHQLDRKQASGKFLANILKSLDQIANYADRRKVKLGIETRFYHREIPSFDEVGMILDKFRGSSVFYWHDTGHAQVTQELGFAKHKDFLDAYSKNILGVHLHDVKNCRDHLPPPIGNIDFSFVAGYLKKDTLKVLEAHQPATGQDLKKAKVFLENALKI